MHSHAERGNDHQRSSVFSGHIDTQLVNPPIQGRPGNSQRLRRQRFPPMPNQRIQHPLLLRAHAFLLFNRNRFIGTSTD